MRMCSLSLHFEISPPSVRAECIKLLGENKTCQIWAVVWQFPPRLTFHLGRELTNSISKQFKIASGEP